MNEHWPSIVPRQSHRGVYPVVSTWYGYLREEPAAFFTYLYVGEMALRYRRSGATGFKYQLPFSLELRGKALYHLQKQVNGVKRVASDRLLSVILSLAVHEPNQKLLADPTKRMAISLSPLASFQTLDFVSHMATDATHMRAIYRLVPERGGLKNVKTFGIADTLAL